MFPRPDPSATSGLPPYRVLKGVKASSTSSDGGSSHDLCPSLPITARRPPRFDVGTRAGAAGFAAYLDEHGYAVAAGVANVEQVARSKSQMWDFLESIPGTKVARDDVNTWGLSGDWLPSETNGILHGFGFGQSKFMWGLRLLPGVRQAFEAIWGTPDLIVSFDGGNAMRPWRFVVKSRERGRRERGRLGWLGVRVCARERCACMRACVYIRV